MNTTLSLVPMQPLYWLIRFADGWFAGSPFSTRTTNPELAACFRVKDAEVCKRAALALGAEAVPYGRVGGRLVEVRS